MSFSERLTSLQQERNLDKKDIYESIGVSRTSYYRYEIGESEPTVSVLVSLADFFKVSTDYLLGRTNVPINPAMN